MTNRVMAVVKVVTIITKTAQTRELMMNKNLTPLDLKTLF